MASNTKTLHLVNESTTFCGRDTVTVNCTTDLSEFQNAQKHCRQCAERHRNRQRIVEQRQLGNKGII